MGFRPISSASFPEKGLEIAADKVKSEMIRPLYSAPPKWLKKSGNSGMIILKLPMKNMELRHKSQNCKLYN